MKRSSAVVFVLVSGIIYAACYMATVGTLLQGNGSFNFCQQKVTAADTSGSETEKSFSSCLLVLDDNHRLPEWIAYHYFALKLRHLVILPDPRSSERPTELLERWRPYLTIEEWRDETWMTPSYYNQTQEAIREGRDDVDWHTNRQSNFYKECSMHLERLNKTWVSYHDVDEFYVINPRLILDAANRTAKPNSVINVLEELQDVIARFRRISNDAVFKPQYQGPCVTTFRTGFGAIESSNQEISRDVPSFLEARQFETLRWRKHAHPMHAPQVGKSLFDVSRLQQVLKQNKPDVKFWMHDLFPTCPNLWYHSHAYIHLFHYLGSWEYYTYRKNDKRKGTVKSRTQWEEGAYVNGTRSSDDIRPWIAGFVELVGQAKAKELLEGAGLPSDYTIVNDTDWQEKN